MFDFITKFFGRETSSTTARERLRLVLLSDHLSLAPDVVESLKRDLVEVISRYCEVDEANCDVTFEQQDKQVALLANIPIVGMRTRPGPPSSPPQQTPPRAPETPPSFGNAAGASASVASDDPAVTSPGANAKPARKRRRKRSGGAPLTHPGNAGFSPT